MKQKVVKIEKITGKDLIIKNMAGKIVKSEIRRKNRQDGIYL